MQKNEKTRPQDADDNDHADNNEHSLCFILFMFVIIASDIQETKLQDQKLQCLNERTTADETSAYQLKYNKPQAGRSTDLD